MYSCLGPVTTAADLIGESATSATRFLKEFGQSAARTARMQYIANRESGSSDSVSTEATLNSGQVGQLFHDPPVFVHSEDRNYVEVNCGLR